MPRLSSQRLIRSGILFLAFIAMLLFLRGPTLETNCVLIQSGKSEHSIYETIHRTLHLEQNHSAYLRFRVLTWGQAIPHGEFCTDGNSYQAFLANILAGKEAQHSLTIIPGSSISQISHSLRLNDARLYEESRKIHTENYEGHLLPDSYNYTLNDSLDTLFKRAHQAMIEAFMPIWQQRSHMMQAYTFEQALVLASILEKEANTLADRKKIAGVLLNRLLRKQRLQVDATTIAAFPDEYSQGASLAKLTKRYHPVNTYRVSGLPPRPIAMVSLESFEAACHPESHAYYYYVFDGTRHQFSEDYSGHLKVITRLSTSSSDSDETRVSDYDKLKVD